MNGKKSIVHEFKNVLLIGVIPIVLFWLAICLNFLFYPNDMNSASNLIMILTGTGCLLSIFLIIQNMRRMIREK